MDIFSYSRCIQIVRILTRHVVRLICLDLSIWRGSVPEMFLIFAVCSAFPHPSTRGIPIFHNCGAVITASLESWGNCSGHIFCGAVDGLAKTYSPFTSDIVPASPRLPRGRDGPTVPYTRVATVGERCPGLDRLSSPFWRTTAPPG